MRRVILESPYAARTPEGLVCGAGDIDIHIAYARECMMICLGRGEAPFASHLLYTQPGVLRDEDPTQRRIGIHAGLMWGLVADATVVFTDFGVTRGMQAGIDHAKLQGRPVEYRNLSALNATVSPELREAFLRYGETLKNAIR